MLKIQHVLCLQASVTLEFNWLKKEKIVNVVFTFLHIQYLVFDIDYVSVDCAECEWGCV